MAIDLFCYVSKPSADVQAAVNLMANQHQDLFSSRFLISRVSEANQAHKEIALEHGLDAKCVFLVRLNDKSAAELLTSVEAIIKSALGDDSVVILFDNEIRR